MPKTLSVPFPSQHDLDGGSVMTGSVNRIGDFVAIVVDGRDASNISTALLDTRFANCDDQEAAQKISELIEAELADDSVPSPNDATPAPSMELNSPAYEVLKKLLSTIEAPGGLISFPDGTCGCAGDEDWIDLADVALAAKKVLDDAGVPTTLTITESVAQ